MRRPINLSFALSAAAVVTLIVGLIGSGIIFLTLSVLCSAGAGVALLIETRQARAERDASAATT